MAAEPTGTGLLRAASGTVAFTIPADANCVAISIGGYSSTLASALNWDGGAGIDFTLGWRRTYQGGSTAQAEQWYMTSADANWPGTGAQNITLTFNSGDGPVCWVQALKGVDTADPAGDVETNTSSPSEWAASLPNTTADDLAYGAASSYTGPGPSPVDVAPAGSGQTTLLDAEENNAAQLSVGYEVGGTTFEFENFGSAEGGAMTFNGVGATAGLPINIDGNEATDVNINGNAVSAIYLGSTQLWP